jgi:hypothetical protein
MNLRRTIVPAVLAGWVASGSGAVSATDPDLCALAADLEAAVSEATGYPPSGTCPVIRFGALGGLSGSRSQAGAYDPASGIIELAPDLDLSAPYGQSFLLHELVHAAQYRAGRDARVPCAEALETEAYRVQADFLAAHGLRREAVLTRVLSQHLGICPGAAPDY